MWYASVYQVLYRLNIWCYVVNKRRMQVCRYMHVCLKGCAHVCILYLCMRYALLTHIHTTIAVYTNLCILITRVHPYGLYSYKTNWLWQIANVNLLIDCCISCMSPTTTQHRASQQTQHRTSHIAHRCRSQTPLRTKRNKRNIACPTTSANRHRHNAK